MLYISDCTLRDARNAPGMHFDTTEAVHIAKMLDAMGVDEIEAGFLNGMDSEVQLLEALVQANLQSPLCPMVLGYVSYPVENALDLAVKMGIKRICLSMPTSHEFISAKLNRSPRATIVLLRRLVKEAVDRGLSVAFSGEDAARAPIEYIIEYANAGADAGASRFRFAETISTLSPSIMAKKVAALVESIKIPLDVHCHSAWGLGVANSIAAIDAGAQWVSVTIDGIGERGGNTSLAPILLYLHHFKKQTGYKPQYLKPLSDYVASVTHNAAGAFAPITGDRAFQYEYLHQFLHPELYDAFPADMVGNCRDLVYGLRFDGAAYGEQLGLKTIPSNIRDQIKTQVVKKRRALSRKEVENIIVDIH